MTEFFQREFRELSFVTRWNTSRRLREQNIAEHLAFVALYADRTCDMLDVDHLTRLMSIRWAIYHDLPEAGTGDIAGPVKRAYDYHDQLSRSFLRSRFGEKTPDYAGSQAAEAIVRFADRLDEAMYCAVETQMGNRNMGTLLDLEGGRQYKHPAAMVAKRLKNAFDNLAEWNRSEWTMDYMWRTFVISALIDAEGGTSRVVQETKSHK